MKEFEAARAKIINDLNLSLTLQEIRTLELTLSWLYNRGAANALIAVDKG